MSDGTPDSASVIGSDAVLGSALQDPRIAEVMAMGVPAFVRRARNLAEATEKLLMSIEAERSRRLSLLFDLGRRLEALLGTCRATLPAWIEPVLVVLRSEDAFSRRAAAPSRSPQRAIETFDEKVSRFDARWREYLGSISLDSIHQLQRDYNEYYPIEKQCALRRVPQKRFVPVPLLTRDELLARFPLLRES